MPHLDEGQLTELLDGEMRAPERMAAESHLATCAECRQLLDETRLFFEEAGGLVEAVQLPATLPDQPAAARLDDTVAEVPARQIGDPRTPRGGGITAWRSLGWAASIVAGKFSRVKNNLANPRITNNSCNSALANAS